MKFNMLENSMDSLNESIDYYRNGKDYKDERSFKFCILLLSHCAELLLKEILYREHEVLIFENIDNLKRDNEKTIGFKQTLSRIKNICKIELGKYNSYLNDLADIRNKIQHYQFTVTEEICTKIIVASFSAIEYIVYDILNKTFDDFDDIITTEQIKYLHEDQDIYNKRKQDISNDIKENGLKKLGVEYKKGKHIFTPCPNCSEEAVIVEDNKITCKFCGKRYSSIEEMRSDDFNCVISEHMNREIGRRINLLHSIYECEKCGSNTLIYSEVLNAWICLVCENKISTIACNDCGDELPFSEYNYTFAQSYTDTENYMYLCNECGEKLKESEYSCEYEIR